jgi:hypothetical protein
MKGLGRSAALVGLSGVAGMVLTFGVGVGAAHADTASGDKSGNGILDDKKDDGGLFPNGILNDKDKDKDNCVVGGVGVGVVGVGVGGGGAGGGVAAGGGGMADPSTALPLAGAGLGAVLLGVGVASRRRQQGAL